MGFKPETGTNSTEAQISNIVNLNRNIKPC